MMNIIRKGESHMSTRQNIIFLGFILITVIFLTSCTTYNANDPGVLVRKTVDENSNLPFVELNDSKFHVRTFGNPENPVIFFQHGGPGSDSRHLEELRKPLKDGYKLEDDYFLVFLFSGISAAVACHVDIIKMFLQLNNFLQISRP